MKKQVTLILSIGMINMLTACGSTESTALPHLIVEPPKQGPGSPMAFTEVTICHDTDNSMQGTLDVSTALTAGAVLYDEEEHLDFCKDDLHFLYEQYCDADGVVAKQPVRCSDIIENGRCVVSASGSARCEEQGMTRPETPTQVTRTGKLPRTPVSHITTLVRENPIVDVDVDTRNTCVLRANGDVQCIGQGIFIDPELVTPPMQIPSTQINVYYEPITIQAHAGARAIELGDNNLCSTSHNGDTRCSGILSGTGTGLTGLEYAPELMLTSDAVRQVAVNYGRGCALLEDGTVECFGNFYAQDGYLGDGETSDSLVPLAISNIDDAVDLALGTKSQCVLESSGEVYCWGDGWHGELGDGTNNPGVAEPTLVHLTEKAVAITSTCALHEDGTVSCWSWAGKSDADPYGAAYIPVKKEGLTDIVAIDQAEESVTTCALHVEGTVSCWGKWANFSNWPYGYSHNPQQIVGINDAIDISVGDTHSCALLSDRSVSCWGYSGHGEMGSNDLDFYSAEAIPVTFD